MTGHGLDSFG